MKHTLFLLTIIIFFVACNSQSNVDSNPGIKAANNIAMPSVENCMLHNRIGYSSLKHTYNSLFKTGKVSKPDLILSADTIVYYKEKRHQINLKHYNVRKSIFGVGSLSTGDTTVLLFTKEKQLHYFEVKGVGAFEFIGIKEDRNYFRLALKDCNIYFSLNLNRPDVLITEYTVQSE
jgi:hypothetical protein